METIAPLWLWATFVAIVVFSLFIDFVVLKKQGAHDIGVKEALNWSLIWIALSFLFNGFLASGSNPKNVVFHIQSYQSVS